MKLVYNMVTRLQVFFMPGKKLEAKKTPEENISDSDTTKDIFQLSTSRTLYSR